MKSRFATPDQLEVLLVSEADIRVHILIKEEEEEEGPISIEEQGGRKRRRNELGRFSRIEAGLKDEKFEGIRMIRSWKRSDAELLTLLMSRRPMKSAANEERLKEGCQRSRRVEEKRDKR